MTISSNQTPSTTHLGRHAPVTAGDALQSLLAGRADERAVHARSLATGFNALDTALGGGLGATDLVLLGGLPGVGKTVAALQIARNAARRGHDVVYTCYEHTAGDLLARLLLMELGEQDVAFDPRRELLLETVRTRLTEPGALRELADHEPHLAMAMERVHSYADRLWLVAASGAHVGVPELATLVSEHLGDGGLLVVDYLQKVAVVPDPPDEAERVTRVAEGLKDLAMAKDVSVLAITAADRAALSASRLRLHHLRGSSALAYEADVALIMNGKYETVSKVHLAYNTGRADDYRNYVVVTVEKNRSGPVPVDLELRKDFAHYRFHPEAAHVRERLVDERLDVE